MPKPQTIEEFYDALHASNEGRVKIHDPALTMAIYESNSLRPLLNVVMDACVNSIDPGQVRMLLVEIFKHGYKCGEALTKAALEEDDEVSPGPCFNPDEN